MPIQSLPPKIYFHAPLTHNRPLMKDVHPSTLTKDILHSLPTTSTFPQPTEIYLYPPLLNHKKCSPFPTHPKYFSKHSRLPPLTCKKYPQKSSRWDGVPQNVIKKEGFGKIIVWHLSPKSPENTCWELQLRTVIALVRRFTKDKLKDIFQQFW